MKTITLIILSPLVLLGVAAYTVGHTLAGAFMFGMEVADGWMSRGLSLRDSFRNAKGWM